MKQLLTTYMKAIAATTKQGDAREESYYPALKALFSDIPLEKGRKTKVTVLPKKTEAGNPDFRVWDGDHFIVGFQVLHKYLKDRKGRQMDDPWHYIHIATSLAKTIEIQAEIDELYPEVEKDVIEF